MNTDNCEGCRYDIYNKGGELEAEGGCWMLPHAKLIAVQKVGMWDSPPHDDVPVTQMPDCYRQTGFAFLRQQ